MLFELLMPGTGQDQLELNINDRVKIEVWETGDFVGTITEIDDDSFTLSDMVMVGICRPTHEVDYSAIKDKSTHTWTSTELYSVVVVPEDYQAEPFFKAICHVTPKHIQQLANINNMLKNQEFSPFYEVKFGETSRKYFLNYRSDRVFTCIYTGTLESVVLVLEGIQYAIKHHL